MKKDAKVNFSKIAWTADSSSFAVNDGAMIIIHSLDSSKPPLTLEGHMRNVTDLAFNPKKKPNYAVQLMTLF